jgi:ketosteroid isomerase-like protein
VNAAGSKAKDLVTGLRPRLNEEDAVTQTIPEGTGRSDRKAVLVTSAGSGIGASEEVAAAHVQWVWGWERQDGDGRFSFGETFERFYDWSYDQTLLYDDFDPEHRVATSPAEYGAIWEPSFNNLRSAEHGVVSGPDLVTSGSLASSSLVFVARLETLDGTVTGIRTTTSLVWRLTDSGWRIIREHNSSVVVPVKTIRDQLGRRPAV